MATVASSALPPAQIQSSDEDLDYDSTEECDKRSKKRLARELKRTAQLQRRQQRKEAEAKEAAKLERENNKESMRTADDVLKRISWDVLMEPHRITVGYLDRFRGLIELPYMSFNWGGDIAALGPDELAIPQHRIQYFNFDGVPIWDKRIRLDNVFGSCGGTQFSKTLEAINTQIAGL